MSPKSKREAKEPEPIDPSQVEGPVEDGLLIARSAASISVANRIIVSALREDQDFDRDRTREMVRDELGHLADEQADLATRMGTTRTKALKSRGRSRHQFDYRRDDDEQLALRGTISTSISARLDALRGDSAYVDEIVTAARDRAWNDIGATIVSRVRAVVVPDATYGEHRDERLRELLDVDLASLLSGRSDVGGQR